MKVTETSPDRLVIEDRPWFLWLAFGILGGAALISALLGLVEGGWAERLLVGLLGAGALGVGWHFAPFQRFTFDRANSTFTHDIRRITGARTWTRPLREIRRAADEGNWSDGSRLERITLLTEDGRYPMESGFTSQSRNQVIKAINAWLGLEIDRLRPKLKPQLFTLLLGHPRDDQAIAFFDMLAQRRLAQCPLLVHLKPLHSA